MELTQDQKFKFRYRMEQEAEQATGQPAPDKASMGDELAGHPITRLGMGLASPLIGAAQVGAHVGDLANKAMGVDPVVSPWIDKKLKEYDESKQRGMKAAGDEGFDAMGLIGSLLPGAAIARGVGAALPAATSALGRIGIGAAIGGATSATQPITNSPDFWEDKGKQTGIGAAIGGAIPAVSEALRAARGAPQLNPVQAQTLREGQHAGYVVPPSSVNPSFLNNRMESLAGKASVGQEAARRNQEVTNALAARELGMPQGTPLTEDTLRVVRNTASAPYRDVSALSPRAEQALMELRQARFEASDQYRFYARSGNPDARRAAEALTQQATALEAEIDTIAGQTGRPALVNQLRDARRLIAKTYDIENSLNLGGGNVSAPIIGRQLDRTGVAGKSGNLAVVGRMAEAFPRVMQEGSRVPASGVSGTDAAASAILGTLGYGAGGPAGLLAAGIPLARGPARNLVLSRAYQNFATSDPSRYQAIIDALAQQGAGAAGTTAGRGVQP